jgi:hypothetical protein
MIQLRPDNPAKAWKRDKSLGHGGGRALVGRKTATEEIRPQDKIGADHCGGDHQAERRNCQRANVKKRDHKETSIHGEAGAERRKGRAATSAGTEASKVLELINQARAALAASDDALQGG